NLGMSGFVPPDAMGAVGPTQILVVVNGRIRTFTRGGLLDGAIDTTTDSFFNSVRNSSSTTDPRVVFDRLQQRWFIVMINTSTPNRVLIAVSSSATITSSGSGSFTFYFFQHDRVGTTPNSNTGQFADFPSLGVDNNALYIGANIMNSSDAYQQSSVFVVNKANLLGTPPTLTVTAFRSVATNVTGGPFAPLGVTNMDSTATEGYFIGVNTTSFGSLRLRRISNPGGTTSISSNSVSITVSSTTTPMDVPAQGSTIPLDK